MKAEALTPAEIFGYHVRYVVPLFQRPYVWNRADQWEPLWEDVRTVAQRLLDRRPGSAPVAPHFLGAIVVEQASTPVGSVAVYHVIDGQQRLTTLQLLLEAVRRVLVAHDVDAGMLRLLVRNETAVRRDDEQGKVWPAIGDRDAYLAAMESEGTEPLGEAAVVQARAYFVEAVTGWAAPAQAPPDEVADRLAAVARAVAEYLRAVVIHLDPGDNAQGIFETLNHRGVPLLAADLIKNLVFRGAQAQGLDVVALYEAHWSELDQPFWRAYVRRGRQVVPRIDIFVNYWLVMRLVAEVRTDQIFASFRDHLLDAGPAVEDLLVELVRDARTYAATRGTAVEDAARRSRLDAVPARFCYRVLEAMDAGVVTPFYLWLMRWPADVLPTGQRDRALAALESWVVRRWLAGLTSKDTANVVLDLLQALDRSGPERAGEVTEAFLLAQRAAGRAWPSDQAVHNSLQTTAVDPRALRPRLRMLLEAIEDRQRTDMSEGTACERDLTVEHVMPLGWRQHWSIDGLDPAAQVLRDTLVHTLGNLTLVRWKLNHELANLPWTDADTAARGLGPTGKRSALASHSLLRINADLVAANPEVWTEQAISVRTGVLARAALAVWPRPAAASSPAAQLSASLEPRSPDPAPEPSVVDPPDRESTVDITGGRSKYALLTEFLGGQRTASLPLTFQQIEDVMDAPLPPSARTSIPYWSRTKAGLGAAISNGGYRPSHVDLWNERVILARTPTRRPRPLRRRPSP
jgi:hypothetical protein